MVLALPLVSSLQFYAGYPLRLITAQASTWLLQAGGWTAARSGTAMLVDGRLVIVDAPCSGLGVLNRRPDLRWRAEPLPDLQRDLLRAAAERVKPGGTIVYSVCTMNVDENEAIVDASGLAADELGVEWPAFRHPTRPEFLLTLPHVHGTAGFFIARLRT